MTPAPFSLQPVALAPAQAAAASSAKPVTTDFLLMLAQLVGAPVTTSGGSQATAGIATADTEDLAEDAPSSDLAALFPFSLPVLAPQPQGVAAVAQDGIAQISTDAGRAPVTSLDAKLLADLIESEQQTADEPTFDRLTLPVTPPESHAQARTQATDALLSRPVHSPVGSSHWADEVGSRLSLMLDQSRQSASLRLSPEHLGPLEIRIAIQDDQASVWFGASHADTRAALENALPRLRELLESQGLTLSDAGVFHEPPREQAAPIAQQTEGAAADPGAAQSEPVAIRRVSLALIDAYA
jgi:flagellar hook-length control protein FliK